MKKIFIILFVVSIATNVAFIGNWFVAPQNPAVCDARTEEPVDKVVRFLQDARVFYIATVDGEQARVRPFGAALNIDGKLSISTGAKKNVARQIKDNPNVEISAMVGDGKSIRITGPLEDRTTPANRKKFLHAMPSLAGLYSGKEEQFTVLSFTHATAVIKDLAGYKEVIELK